MSGTSSAAGSMTLRQSLAQVWRTLRSMRTALILLLVLALASVAGSLIPQLPNSPERVQAFLRDHRVLGRWYLHAGLFDVFGSWWFTLIYTLLILSLVACILPRTRALLRNVFARPTHARELAGMRHHASRRVAAEPEAAAAAARRVLRRRLFRLNARSDGDGAAVAAEKGRAREVGSLLFHWSFLLILVGVVWGKGTGFSGRAFITEGETWTLARTNFDGRVQEGRFFGGDYDGIGIRVRDFEDTYRRTGQPMDFVTHADLLDPQGRVAESVDIRVNHPAEIEGVKFYQYGFGWAPVVEVRSDGKLIASGPIQFVPNPPPKGVSELAVPWHGTLKLPSLHPQVGIQFELWPDLDAFVSVQQTGKPVLMTTPNHPFLLYRVFEGDLLDDPSRTDRLNTTAMREVTTGVAGSGTTVDVATGEILEPGASGTAGATGMTISFPRLEQYTVLQVKRDRGLGLMAFAALLVLVGLVPALYSARRRVWVRAEPTRGGGSMLQIGGFALQRKARFEEEFDRLVRDLVAAAGGAPRDETVLQASTGKLEDP